MSRHRDVRCMNYSDEYDGYDDVYGHSVEDDYCTSPSAEQFMYDRNKQANIASFITEPDIVEGNEEDEEDIPSSFKLPQLSDLDAAKLMSCLEAIKNVVGDTHPESELNRKIIEFNYNTEAVLDSILNDGSAKKDKDQQKPMEKTESQPDCKSENASNYELVPNPLQKQIKEEKDASFGSKNVDMSAQDSHQKNSFNSLADLTAHHLAGKTSNSFSKFSIPKMNFGNESNSTPDLHAPAASSSLFDLISQQSTQLSNRVGTVDSNTPGKLGIKIKTEKIESAPQSFSCLADLTAHHLKITNDDGQERKVNSIPSFLIPKDTAKSWNADGVNTSSSFLADLNAHNSRLKKDDFPSSKIASQVTAVKVKMEKFQQNYDDMTNSVLNNISNLNFEEKYDPHKVIKVEPLDQFERENDFKSDFPEKNTSVKMFVSPVQTRFDSEMCKSLRTTKVSSLGKVLCKSYYRSVPYPQREAFKMIADTESVVRFDFSSPSPDQIILDRLRFTKSA